MGQLTIRIEREKGIPFASRWASVANALRRWILRLAGITVVHQTKSGVLIAVQKGEKLQSPYDFVVKYKEPNNRWRTPKHVHLIVEMYVKEAYNQQLTYQLRQHLLNVFQQVQSISAYPPGLQVYKSGDEAPFQALDTVGEFSVEFLLVVSELIFIQEKTNYPTGSLTYELYRDFGQKDRFSVIHKATYRG